MANFNIWIRDPYPFRLVEQEALLEALPTRSAVYMHDWPIHYVSIDNATLTFCKQIAAILKTVHKQWAILDNNSMGREYCKHLEIEIRDAGDGRPEWAKVK